MRDLRTVIITCVTALLIVSTTAVAQSKPATQPDDEQRPSQEAREQHRAQMRESLLEQFDLSNPQIDMELLKAGGPPKDGIPALTDPKRAKVTDAEYPSDSSRVVAVEINSEAVAYPLGILNWHEIANDTIAGMPIAVVYCPLCDSVTVMDRRLTDKDDKRTTRVLEFGVSGLLANSNVVMYERNTDALWSQVLLQAITGPDAGRSLRHLPVRMMTFAEFKNKFPDGEVLTKETGHERPYDRNPYAGYFKSDRLFMNMDFDDALPAKTLGLGIRAGDVVTFVTAEAASNTPITVHTPLGDVVVSAEPDVGMTVLNAPAEALIIQTFWHSWSAYFPNTKIYSSSDHSTTQPDTK